MSWYYVDPAGATKGPLSIAQLKPLYGSEVKDNTYIWNGTTVAQWTALNKCADVLKQIKPSPQRAKPAPGAPGGGGARRRRRRRRRKSPFGGGAGGRGGLLDAIRAGKKLNKTPAPKENGPSGGGGGGGGSRPSNKPMSLMEQMKAAQNKRKKGGGGGKKKSPSRAPVKKAEPAWKKEIKYEYFFKFFIWRKKDDMERKARSKKGGRSK